MFGFTDINNLVIAIVYEGVAFPVKYTIMPEPGNIYNAECNEFME